MCLAEAIELFPPEQFFNVILGIGPGQDLPTWFQAFWEILNSINSFSEHTKFQLVATKDSDREKQGVCSQYALQMRSDTSGERN